MTTPTPGTLGQILDVQDTITKARSLIWCAMLSSGTPDMSLAKTDARALADVLDVADNLLEAALEWLDEYRAANGGKTPEARPN